MRGMIAWVSQVEGQLFSGFLVPRVGLVVHHCCYTGDYRIVEVHWEADQMTVEKVGNEAERRTLPIGVAEWTTVRELEPAESAGF